MTHPIAPTKATKSLQAPQNNALPYESEPLIDTGPQ
jgi:hypothetical protein